MIIATAGHVDHGKSSLVKALTGIDTDTLAEEKRRGISIDLGFAHWRVPPPHENAGQSLFFVDVPGHERFVRNLLAGVSSVDAALLTVALDDGPMPQTLEHIQILAALGIDQIVVALTKADLVDSPRHNQVTQQISQCLADAGLRPASIHAVSISNRPSIDALSVALAGLKQRQQRALASGLFRLAIDRSFVVRGDGLVVTGSIDSGTVSVGDSVTVSPRGLEARIRGIHRGGERVPRAQVGERCALNLTGPQVDRESAQRGDWIVAAPAHVPTQIVEVETVHAKNSSAIRDHHRLSLHIGAADVPATVLVIQPSAGGQLGALLRLRLHRPILATHGERALLRDSAIGSVLAGVRVLDPAPRTRMTLQSLASNHSGKEIRVAHLTQLRNEDASTALNRQSMSFSDGVCEREFQAAWQLSDVALARTMAQAGVICHLVGQSARLLHLHTIENCEQRIESTLDQFHQRQPEKLGLEWRELAALTHRSPNELTTKVALERLLQRRSIRRYGTLIHRAGHSPALNERDQLIWQQILPRIKASGLKPPRLHELALALTCDAAVLEPTIERICATGRAWRVAPNRCFLATQLTQLCAIASALATGSPEQKFSAAMFNAASGLGRNLTIEVLEFFDRQRITRRHGDNRVVLEGCDSGFGEA